MIHALSNFIVDVFKKAIAITRSILVFGFALLLLFVFLIVISNVVSSSSDTTSVYTKESVIKDEGGKEKIVVVPLSGIILTETTPSLLDPSGSVITPSFVQTILKQAKQDPLVKAVIFDINSPGGSPVASDRIFEMITSFKKETSKPVIFLMGDLTASGGYYVASAADYIVANPATITGSIGVILESYNLEELYKKIGVSKSTFKEGQYKDILSESRPVTPEEQKIIQSLNENTYNLFISKVAQGRKMPEDMVRSLANGQIYSGRQAKDLKLVDSLGNMDEAIYQAKALAQLEHYQVVEYEFTSFFDNLFARLQLSVSPQVALQQFFAIPTFRQR